MPKKQVNHNIVAQAREALLGIAPNGTVVDKGIPFLVAKFKGSHQWQDSENTKYVLKNLLELADALGPFLNSVERREKSCSSLNLLEQKNAIQEVLLHLKTIQQIMAKLVYQPEVFAQLQDKPENKKIYVAARGLVDAIFIPLLKDSMIHDLVLPLYLTRQNIGYLNKLPSSDPILGLLKDCKLENIAHYNEVIDLLNIHFLQLIDPEKANQLRANFSSDSDEFEGEEEAEVKVFANNPAKELSSAKVEIKQETAIKSNTNSRASLQLVKPTMLLKAQATEKGKALIKHIRSLEYYLVLLFSVYKEAEEITTLLTNTINSLKAIDKDLSLEDYEEQLKQILNNTPAPFRAHIKRVLCTRLQSENISVSSYLQESDAIASEAAAKPYRKKSPLIIHMAGTKVTNRNPDDVLASVVREYQNFQIIEGAGTQTDSLAFAGDGRARANNIISQLHAMDEVVRPKHLVLTGYSRGAAVQLELARLIHETFNKGKDQNDWIRIDIFLDDAARGTVDLNSNAATRNQIVPECVNSLNMVCADDESVHAWHQHFTHKREPSRLKYDPNFTTVNTLTLKGRHKELGLRSIKGSLQPLGIHYFLDQVVRQFLDSAGCLKAKSKKIILKSPIPNEGCKLSIYAILPKEITSDGYFWIESENTLYYAQAFAKPEKINIGDVKVFKETLKKCMGNEKSKELSSQQLRELLTIPVNYIKYFNKSYLQEAVVSAQQDLTVGYTASDAARLKNKSAHKNKSVEFSNQLGSLAILSEKYDEKLALHNTKKDQYYHQALCKIRQAILHGKYTVSALSTTTVWHRERDGRNQSRLPKHMAKMLDIIEGYLDSDKQGLNAPDKIFKTVQGKAHIAIERDSYGRDPKVQFFYENIINTPPLDEQAFEAEDKSEHKFLLDLREILTPHKKKIEKKNETHYPAVYNLAKTVFGTANVDGYYHTQENKNLEKYYQTILNKIDELLLESIDPHQSKMTKLESFINDYPLTSDEKTNSSEVKDDAEVKTENSNETAKTVKPKIEYLKNTQAGRDCLALLHAKRQEMQQLQAQQFNKIADEVVLLVNQYDTYAKQNCFSRNAKNVSVPRELRVLVEGLKQNCQSPVDNLQALKAWVDKELSFAQQRHQNNCTYKASTLFAYARIGKETQSYLVQLLTQAQNKVHYLNPAAELNTIPVALKSPSK